MEINHYGMKIHRFLLRSFSKHQKTINKDQTISNVQYINSQTISIKNKGISESIRY